MKRLIPVLALALAFSGPALAGKKKKDKKGGTESSQQLPGEEGATRGAPGEEGAVREGSPDQQGAHAAECAELTGEAKGECEMKAVRQAEFAAKAAECEKLEGDARTTCENNVRMHTEEKPDNR